MKYRPGGIGRGPVSMMLTGEPAGAAASGIDTPVPVGHPGLSRLT